MGSEEFRKPMLEKMESKLGDHHSGQLPRETAETKAERIIAEELGRLKWQMAELESRPKTDPGKLAIAARLRKEPTLPMKDIAARVCLGTFKSANARLHVWMNQTPAAQPGQTELGL